MTKKTLLRYIQWLYSHLTRSCYWWSLLCWFPWSKLYLKLNGAIQISQDTWWADPIRVSPSPVNELVAVLLAYAKIYMPLTSWLWSAHTHTHTHIYILSELFLRKPVHSLRDHFIITLIISDRPEWRDTRGKWPLARNPERSWWHRHTSLKLFWLQPMALWRACITEYKINKKSVR
jgi:hypothetical protein